MVPVSFSCASPTSDLIRFLTVKRTILLKTSLAFSEKSIKFAWFKIVESLERDDGDDPKSVTRQKSVFKDRKILKRLQKITSPFGSPRLLYSATPYNASIS